MLYEGAIGDAFGASFEYAPADYVGRHLYSNKYVPGPRHRLTPGCYTDDTQMSLAIAELLIDNEPWTSQVIADKFVHVFKRDPRKGYSGSFYELLNAVDSGEELLALINPISDKSGAAMRAACIGHLPDLKDVIGRAEIQAKITHNTPDGIAAAVVAACAAWFVMRGERGKLGQRLNDIDKSRDWRDDYIGPVGSKGLDAVHAAITAVRNHNSLDEILRASVAYTGDVDTVATIAMQVASAKGTDVKLALPPGLTDGLENKNYGRVYLINIDKLLVEQVSR